MKSEKYTIFLSYAREDEAIAIKLFNDLSKMGLSIWFDRASLHPGQRWKQEIEKAISQCRYFVALMSSHSVSKTGYVQKEMHEALEILDQYPEAETFIVPVRVDDCKPSHEKLKGIHWVDLFPSYEEGIRKLLRVFIPMQEQMTVIALQDVNEIEIANAVDIANATQMSYRFMLYPTIVSFDKSAYLLPNGAFDFDNAIDDLVKEQKYIQELLYHRPIFVTSLPYSDKKLVEEYSGESLLAELSQCYFHEIYEYPLGNASIISTFIWEHLPPNNSINLPKSPSGRRALQPYLLFEFASIILDPLADLPFHEETRGCPFDYCNNVRDIDESFRIKALCPEHIDFLQKQVGKAKLTQEQLDSAIKLFNRSFSKTIET